MHGGGTSLCNCACPPERCLAHACHDLRQCGLVRARLGPSSVPVPSWPRMAGLQVVTEVAKGSRGVVGCTPILKPGECFEYYSGTDVDTPGGRMRGSFQMAVVDPQRPQDLPSHTFDAEVAPFYFVPAGGGA